MAWTIRSLDELSSRVRGAFRQYLPGTDTALKNNFVTIVAKVLAGLGHEFELRMGWAVRQLFTRTAAESVLPVHGKDVNIFRKQPAPASGTIAGTGEANAIYPAGIRFVSGNNTYLSTSPAQASPLGAISLSVTAEDKGAVTNRDAGGTMTLSDPGLYPTLGTTFTVADGGLGGGADLEDVEDFRERILFRKANPPGAGALPDYERVALEVPGVLKAWAFRPPLAPGSIVLFFLFKDRPNLIPTAGDVAVVQAAIDARRMIRVDDNVAVAPTPDPLNPIIRNLTNDTADIRSAIATAVTVVLYSRARPGVSGNPFTLSRSWVTEAISGVAGEDSHELDWPLTDLPYTDGKYPVLGEITYV